MKITRLEVKIEPWLVDNRALELRVVATCEGNRFSTSQVFQTSDFEMVFDRLMEHAKDSIKTMVKDHEAKEAASPFKFST